jgi:hypothetical protein
MLRYKQFLKMSFEKHKVRVAKLATFVLILMVYYVTSPFPKFRGSFGWGSSLGSREPS